jgi:hypothetical protein
MLLESIGECITEFKEEEYTLTADGDVAVSFGPFASAAPVIIKVAPNVGVASSDEPEESERRSS